MQNSKGQNVLISGRIVWTSGDLFKGKPEFIFGTKTPKLDKTGKQMVQFGFGLAVPKMKDGQANPELNAFKMAMGQEAGQIFTGHIPPSFAWKFKDGDGIDDKGKPFSERPGYAGCDVFNLTTYQAIKYFKWENGSNVMINQGIKCGDYIRVSISIKAHGAVGQGKPGLYLNPEMVQLVAFGEEIIPAKTVDADSVFGNVAPAVPPGGSTAPVAPPFPGQQQQMPSQSYHGVLPQHMQQQMQQPQQQTAPAGFPFPFKPQ